MSIFTKKEIYAHPAPGTAYDPSNPALQFEMNDRAVINVVYYNLGQGTYYPIAQSGNSMTIKIQDSADGAVWADVAGTAQVVVPMGKVAVAGVSVRKYFRVLAFGNTEGQFEIDVDETLDLTKI